MKMNSLQVTLLKTHSVCWMMDFRIFLGMGKKDINLALQFDIQRYVDILADSVFGASEGVVKGAEYVKRSKGSAAGTLVPQDNEWEMWSLRATRWACGP